MLKSAQSTLPAVRCTYKLRCSGLVLAILIGKRKGIEKRSVVPHNIPFVVLGASLLWFGWFGFNAGSALAADGLALHAFTTTNTSAACAMLSWMIIDIIKGGKPTVVGLVQAVLSVWWQLHRVQVSYRYGRRLLSVHLSARFVILHYLY